MNGDEAAEKKPHKEEMNGDEAEKKPHKGELHVNDLYEAVGSYGAYQMLQFAIMIWLSIGMAANSVAGYMSLGGTIPAYICHDSDDGDASALTQFSETLQNMTVRNATQCLVMRTCKNLTIETTFHSVGEHFRSKYPPQVYESFEFACESDRLSSTIATISSFIALPGFMLGVNDFFPVQQYETKAATSPTTSAGVRSCSGA